MAEHSELYAFAGHLNPSLARYTDASGGKLQLGDVCDAQAVAAFAREHEIDIAMISADEPLEAGVVDELLAALHASRWNLAGAAGRLGVSRTSLYARVERHGGIRKAGDLSRDEIAAALERCGGDLDAAADELGVSPHGLKIRRTELESD